MKHHHISKTLISKDYQPKLLISIFFLIELYKDKRESSVIYKHFSVLH